MEIIKIGIIGCGWIVQKAHISSIQKQNEVEICALFDTNIKRMREVQKKYSIENIYSDFENFINSGITAAIVASPNYTHAEYTKKLLKRGISVLCEKPVALKKDEVEEIEYLAEKNNAIFVPGVVNRWRTEIQLINAYIKTGGIGKLKEIETGWVRKKGIPNIDSWFTRKRLSGGGVLIDLGSHILDICLMFIENKKIENIDAKVVELKDIENVSELSANWYAKDNKELEKYDVEGKIETKISFSDGIDMNVKLAWIEEISGDYTYFIINGDKGSIFLKTLFGFSNQQICDNHLIIRNEYGMTSLDNYIDNTLSAFEKMYTYFLCAIRFRDNSMVQDHVAMNTVALIEKIYECIR